MVKGKVKKVSVKDKTGGAPKSPVEVKPGPFKLHLGCGNDIKKGYENLDINDGNIEREGVVHCDLEEGKLPYPDNSCTEVEAVHLLEHIKNLGPLMNEVQRVLKPNGYFNIEVPVYPYPEAFQDPTHVRFFTENTFLYFVKNQGLYEGYGKIYGYKPFSWINIARVGRAIQVKLKK